jgi:hypothetical protein
MVLLILSYGRARNNNKSFALPTHKSDPGNIEPVQQTNTAASLFPASIVSASGLPVTLTLAAVNASPGIATATCRVNNQSSETLSGVHLLLLKFNEAKRLERVEGGIVNLKLAPNTSGDVSLDLKGRFSDRDRLFVTPGAVYGTRSKWWVTASSMVEAIASSLFNSNVSLPSASQISDVDINDYGSVFCHQAFQQAMTPPSVQQAGSLGVTFFTCGQTDRTYEIGYGPVVNKQP